MLIGVGIHVEGGDRSKPMLVRVLTPLFGAFCMSVTVVQLTSTLLGVSWNTVVGALIGSALLLLPFWFPQKDAPIDFRSMDSILRALPLRGWRALLVAPFTLGGLFIFLSSGAYLWGQVSPSFGGGQAVPVTVAVDSTFTPRAVFDRLGVAVDSTGTLECLLLARESDYFVLCAPSGRTAVMIPSRSVRAAATTRSDATKPSRPPR
jgi:hypothetical protein